MLAFPETSFEPEQCPYSTIFVDVTHRCNMECHNCYIPNRDIPDMDAGWLESILKRIPKRKLIRLVGAEPTMRRDLPKLIRMVRSTGHWPIILTNGLACAKRAYVAKLKAAGLRTVYLSMNGGISDPHYMALDNMACARPKMRALDNLAAERMRVLVGMNLARGVNDAHLGEFWPFLKERREVCALHLRSIGPMGRYLNGTPFTIDELIELARTHLGLDDRHIAAGQRGVNVLDTKIDGIELQLTQWPDLGSSLRGRLTPAGRVEPFFEHVIANAARGGY